MLVNEIIKAIKSKNIAKYLLTNYKLYIEMLKNLDFEINNLNDDYKVNDYKSPLAR